tara:strand:- start:1311 stop:1988 length:678 start_codon:yes stop_codon:yes gene_type:complete
MNFFSNKLSSKDYLKLLKNNFSKKFILENSGMLIGDKALYRQIKILEIIKNIELVKGDIIEFGIWHGNNLFMVKKIVDFYKLKKRVIGYDNFSGFPNPAKLKKLKKGKYIGKPELINKILKFFKLSNVKIINDDILNLEKHKKIFNKISFVYIDCNVYEPVKKILETLNNKISKGGIIAFDEAQNKNNKSEGIAMMEFYNRNKKSYKLIKLNKNYQPDAILIKKN